MNWWSSAGANADTGDPLPGLLCSCADPPLFPASWRAPLRLHAPDAASVRSVGASFDGELWRKEGRAPSAPPSFLHTLPAAPALPQCLPLCLHCTSVARVAPPAPPAATRSGAVRGVVLCAAQTAARIGVPGASGAVLGHPTWGASDGGDGGDVGGGGDAGTGHRRRRSDVGDDGGAAPRRRTPRCRETRLLTGDAGGDVALPPRRRTPRCREIRSLTGGDGGGAGDAALPPGGGRRAAGRHGCSPATRATMAALPPGGGRRAAGRHGCSPATRATMAALPPGSGRRAAGRHGCSPAATAATWRCPPAADAALQGDTVAHRRQRRRGAAPRRRTPRCRETRLLTGDAGGDVGGGGDGGAGHRRGRGDAGGDGGVTPAVPSTCEEVWGDAGRQ